MNIGILGGGLTGLSLGYFLKEKGIDFEILEKDSECGGLCRTVQEEGFTFDRSGGHIIFSKDEEVLNLILFLLSGNINKCKRNTKILYKGKYIKYPFENGLYNLSKEEMLECLKYFIEALIKKKRGEFEEPQNFKEWVYQTFGKGIADKYLIPYNEKIWKTDTSLLGLEWVKIKDRLPQPNAEDIIKSSLGIETEGYLPQLFFFYPTHGGIQSLIKSIEKKIENMIVRGFDVKKIVKEGEKWVVSSGAEAKEFNLLISTIPIVDLVQMIDAPPEIRKATGSLKYNSLITVLIGLKTDKLPDFHWVYVPDPEIIFHRVIFPKNNSSEMAPSGKSAMEVEITCKFQDEFWKKTDEEIIRGITDQLSDIFSIDKSSICFTKVERAKYSYVINDLSYSKNLDTIKRFVENLGIKLCGRFAEFKYLNMDACIRSAMDLVRKI